MEYRQSGSRGSRRDDCKSGGRWVFRIPDSPSKKARRACPRTRRYPDNKVGHWILIAGVVVMFMFAPTWLWVVGLGTALILIGLKFMSHE